MVTTSNNFTLCTRTQKEREWLSFFPFNDFIKGHTHTPYIIFNLFIHLLWQHRCRQYYKHVICAEKFSNVCRRRRRMNLFVCLCSRHTHDDAINAMKLSLFLLLFVFVWRPSLHWKKRQ